MDALSCDPLAYDALAQALSALTVQLSFSFINTFASVTVVCELLLIIFVVPSVSITSVFAHNYCFSSLVYLPTSSFISPTYKCSLSPFLMHLIYMGRWQCIPTPKCKSFALLFPYWFGYSISLVNALDGLLFSSVANYLICTSKFPSDIAWLSSNAT